MPARAGRYLTLAPNTLHLRWTMRSRRYEIEVFFLDDACTTPVRQCGLLVTTNTKDSCEESAFCCLEHRDILL